MRRLDNLAGLISISFVGGIFGRAFEYLVYIAIARSLGAGALGAFSFGLVLMNISSVVAKLGLDKAARKFVPIYSDNESELTGVLLTCICGGILAGLIASGTIYLGQDVIVRYSSEAYGPVILLFLIGIPLKVTMTVGRAATTGFLTTKYSVYIKDFGQSGTAILLVAVGGFLVGSVEGVVVGYVMSFGFASALALWFLYRQGGFAGVSNPNFRVREVLVFSLPLTLASAAQFLISWTDILMLGVFESAEIVGTYQAAYQTAVILGFLLFAVGTIFPSIVSDLYDAGEISHLHETFSALTKWVTYLSVLGYTFMVIFRETILTIFGTEFVIAETVLIVIGASQVFSSMVGPSGYLLMMTDYERLEMANTVVASVLNVVLNYYFIHMYGLLGAAIATGLSVFFLNAIRLLEIKLVLGIFPNLRRYWKGIIGVTGASVCMYGASLIPISRFILLIPVGMVGLGVFATLMYGLGFDTEDHLLIESV